MNELKEKYIKKIMPELRKELGIENNLAIPRIEKIVLNAGVSEAVTNPVALTKMQEDLTLIAGQKAVKTKAHGSIANFKIRQGQEIGVRVTLRGEKMWIFLQKLVTIVLPQVKDFRGVPRSAFDGHGNYSLGVKEHNVFPEIDPNRLDKIRSFQIIIVTSSRNDKESLALLQKIGMPFAKSSDLREAKQMETALKEEQKIKKEKE